MDNRQILQMLISIVKSIKADASINEDTALSEQHVLDSLEFMNYITKVEESFSLYISDSEISKLQLGIINNMIDFIKSKI